MSITLTRESEARSDMWYANDYIVISDTHEAFRPNGKIAQCTNEKCKSDIYMPKDCTFDIYWGSIMIHDGCYVCSEGGINTSILFFKRIDYKNYVVVTHDTYMHIHPNNKPTYRKEISIDYVYVISANLILVGSDGNSSQTTININEDIFRHVYLDRHTRWIPFGDINTGDENGWRIEGISMYPAWMNKQMGISFRPTCADNTIDYKDIVTSHDGIAIVTKYDDGRKTIKFHSVYPTIFIPHRRIYTHDVSFCFF